MPASPLGVYRLLTPYFLAGFTFPDEADAYLSKLGVVDLTSTFDESATVFSGTMLFGDAPRTQRSGGGGFRWDEIQVRFRLTVPRDGAMLISTAATNTNLAQLKALLDTFLRVDQSATTGATEYPGVRFRLELMLDEVHFELGDEWTPGKLDGDYRRRWAWLRFREGWRVTPQTIYRILAFKGWFVHQRAVTPHPRAQGRVSRTEQSHERWATDVTHVILRARRLGHLTVVLDCHDRECIGWEFARRGRAKEAERALEEACLARFGTLRPTGPTPVIRSDNGLIYQSRCFRAACRDYRLCQEFITPYTPEQNGLVERFFRCLKEESVWQHVFRDLAEARQEITAWIRWYNTERPHQALGYRSPIEWRAQQLTQVA
jgi:putative transposase